jgi:hypothetical protein
MNRALILFVLAGGCTFPTIDRVVPLDGASGGDTSLSDSISTGDADDSSLGDSTLEDSGDDAVIDTMKEDTFVPDSDAGSCPPGSKGTKPCDCDNDGYIRADSACGGDDCDDDDDRAHPGAGFLTFMPTTKTKGDWNCDGIPQKQKKENISCGLLGDCTVSGFTGTVPCGGKGTVVTCKVVPLGCATNTSQPDVIQACK